MYAAGLASVSCLQSDTHSLLPVFSITPSSSCGPFRELKTMFQAGKRWVKDLEKDNPNLSMLARAHSYLVEHPFFLFLGAGIFLWVHKNAPTHTAQCEGSVISGPSMLGMVTWTDALSTRIVIYFHSQVLDGQRKIISLLQEQIENVKMN